MEQLNRIELRGTVGSVKYQIYNDTAVVRLTLATNLAYKDKDGGAVIDTTWHNVSAWESRDIQNLDKIEKGTKLYVTGRMRNQKFTGVDGVDRYTSEVQARRLVILDEDTNLQCEM